MPVKKSNPPKWPYVLIVAAVIVPALAMVGIAFILLRPAPVEDVTTNTQRLLEPEVEDKPLLACSSGQDHEFTYVRCQSDRYGRMLFVWIDENGDQRLVGDGIYTKDFGILIVSGVTEIIVTFTDMDGKTNWTAVPVKSLAKPCTLANGCYRA